MPRNGLAWLKLFPFGPSPPILDIVAPSDPEIISILMMNQTDPALWVSQRNPSLTWVKHYYDGRTGMSSTWQSRSDEGPVPLLSSVVVVVW